MLPRFLIGLLTTFPGTGAFPPDIPEKRTRNHPRILPLPRIFHLMNRHLLCALLLTASAFSLQAQEKTDKKVVKQLKADIGYLASDELEGRRTGTEGERKALQYIEGRYKKMGIAPYKGDYAHPFEFVYGREIGNATRIRIGNEELKTGKEAFPLSFSGNGSLQGDPLPDVMENGNIWLVSLYKTKDEAENPHYDWEKETYERCKEAQKQGATAVIFYDNHGSGHAPVFNGRSEYEALDIPVVFISNEAYRNYMLNSDGGVIVELNVQLQKTKRLGHNIAAFIDNHAPYTVVLGAHYDHLGHGEDGNSLHAAKDGQVHNGADDNASGTAALMELAAGLKKSRARHYNYLFVHFSGEELGLLGSKAFVKDMALDSSRLAYMINMDMVGRLNDSTRTLTIGGVGTSPAWSTVPDTKLFKVNIDSSGVGPSDHTSFYHAGVPVLFFFTGVHSDYHKPGDDADKINYTGEAQIIRFIRDLVLKMDAQPRPAFTTTRQSTVGKVRFKVTLGIMPDYSYQEKGVRVDGVSEGKPAQKAGLKAGDVITRLGEYPVSGMQSYMEALSHFREGQKTTVVFQRSGQEQKAQVEFK